MTLQGRARARRTAFATSTVDVAPTEPPPSLPSLRRARHRARRRRRCRRAILDAEAALLAAARAQGHALAELGQRQAVVDHDADAMDLTLALQPGPLVRFGEIRDRRAWTSVEEDAVRRRLPWQPGEVITTDALADGRSALFDSGLFSSVVVDLGEAPGRRRAAAGHGRAQRAPPPLDRHRRALSHRRRASAATSAGSTATCSARGERLDDRARRLVHRRPSHRLVPQARLLAARPGADRRHPARLRGHRRLREPLGGRQRRSRAPAGARHDDLRPTGVPRLAGPGARPGQRGVRPVLAAGGVQLGSQRRPAQPDPRRPPRARERAVRRRLRQRPRLQQEPADLQPLPQGARQPGRGARRPRLGRHDVRRLARRRCRRTCASTPAAAARCAASATSSRASSTTTTTRSAGARCSSSRARCACA